jgi:hypothetical protein
MDNEKIPVRPQAVVFEGSPTHEPLACAILITQDPETGELHGFIRVGTTPMGPDPKLVAMLMQSVEIRHLNERNHTA